MGRDPDAGSGGRSRIWLMSWPRCLGARLILSRVPPSMSGCGQPSWWRRSRSMPRDALLLAEMIEAADRMRRDALLWNFAVLGEAATQLSPELCGRFPEVPWRQPARLRNRIVHGYWSIDLDVLYTTAEQQLPGLAAELRRILAMMTAAEGGRGCACLDES